MKGHHQHIIRALTVALAVMLISSSGTAAINKKFYKKVADAVWSRELPKFNAAADLSDPLYQNREAVIIANQIDFTAKYVNTANAAKMTVMGVPTLNAIEATHVCRMMVKLNEPAAVEKFSTMEVPAPQSAKFSSVELLRSQSAFGARIIKPDGRVVEVDITEALPETSGKKDKDASYKIAIPGLETGDVLDYFVYTETYADELQMPTHHLPAYCEYPMRSLRVDYNVSPYLGMEYVCVNGAPDFEYMGSTPDGLNHMMIELHDVDAIETSPPYFSAARQTPYIKVNIVNNTVKLDFVPETARPGGVRKYIDSYLVNDLKSYLNKGSYIPKECIGEVCSLAKNWIKAHPEATERQKADAVWIAASLVADRSEHSFSGRTMAIMFVRALRKLGIDIGAQIAATSSRRQEPFSSLSSHEQPTIMVISRADSCYFPLQSVAGVPNDYDGEDAFVYTASYHPVTGDVTFDIGEPVKLPRPTFKQNTITCRVSAQVDKINEDVVDIDFNLTATGAKKASLPSLTTHSEIRQTYERFLGAKAGKKEKLRDREEVKTQLDANAKAAAKVFSGVSDVRVESYELISNGDRPDSTDLVLNMKMKAPGLVTMAGRNMVVNIGKLAGSQQRIGVAHRERKVSILKDATSRMIHEIVFEIPEGYTVDSESLERLNNNVASRAGAFYSSAKVDGNRVIVARQERYPKTIMNASEWPDLLAVLDAAADFEDATIVLKPL